MLLVMLMAIPLIGALVVLITKNKLSMTAFISSLLVFLLAVWGLKDVFVGMPLKFQIPMIGPFVMSFQADSLSAIFVILASFLWMLVSIYSPKYMEYEGKSFMFQLATLISLFAVLGIFLAANLLTMLLFFELMTIASYFWVIHRWDKGSIKAGYFYLFFSIVGGLLVALGIALMASATESLPLIGSGMVIPTDPKIFTWSIIVLVIGFGIKAGMVPLHLWLPYAHSVAPTPGSALLSGLIIKVGAYGLIRVGEMAGWGVKLAGNLSMLGSAIIILGTATMLLGVLSALIQSNAKKLLAYHSISQMGYIILGLGVGLYLGSQGGFGLSGAIYHIINHALFKVSLFLGVGVIYMHTGETDLYKLGGLWKRFPITALLMLIAVLGITGAPGLNGYASKSILHHGISQAAEAGGWLVWIERLFLVVGVGTAASFSKLFYLMFLGKKTELEISDGGSYKLQIPMALISIVMLVIGIRPHLLLDSAIVPAVRGLGMLDISASLEGLYFWGFRDIIDMIITLGLGALVCWAGLKSGAFHIELPSWLTIEGLGKLGSEKIFGLWERILSFFRNLEGNLQKLVRKTGSNLNGGLENFDRSKTSNILGLDLVGVSADIGIMMLSLAILVALYIFI